MATTLIVLIKRRPDMTAAAFSHHWREIHAPLLLACDDFARHRLRYEQFHGAEIASLSALFGASAQFDGVAAITFPDAQALAAAFAEPAYLADVQPDEANFIDLANCVTFIADPWLAKG